MSYLLKVSPPAERYLKKLKKKNKPLKDLYEEAIKDILRDPYAAGTLKNGDLAGVYGYDINYQSTNYEIAYAIEKDVEGNHVLIILAGSRENFYEELKRYWN